MTIAQVVRPTSTQQSDDGPRGVTERSRISFRQPVSTGGFVDAAWWPRTRDLTTELPALMDVLWTAGREINRITFNLHAWKPAPRRMRIEGRTVRLGGFVTSDPQSVRLSDPWGAERVDILVIAPETDPAVAQRIFDLASQADNPYRVQEILDEVRGAAADLSDRS
jgi:uncharacterized protein DUF5994